MDDKEMNGMPETENVGIMQGFLDSLNEEGDDLEDDDGYGAEMMLERRPDSPEILMNNLRGDMRSIDARRDELADLVGYEVAAETPEPILAMLQPILAQQGGIGALPQSGPMAQGPQPPLGMPPGVPPGGAMPPPPQQGGIAALLAGAGGGAPPGPPPGAPPLPNPAGPGGPGAPVGMARGGPVNVQRFQAGSDEEGVTPVATQEGAALYSPEMLSTAERLSRDLMARKPAATPSLEALIAQKTPQYKKILGDTEGLSQAQMLFELGQRAFGFAGNVDDAGRPLRGGFFSRLAQASRTLPAAMGRHVSEIDKGQRQIKLLAMQAAEKDIDQVTAANQALTKEQRALATEVLKGEARRRAEAAKALGTSIFGKGDWEWSLVNQPNLLARWASGMTNPTEDGLIQSAITKLEQPTFYETVDPQNPARKIQVTRPGVLPPFVQQFQRFRSEFDKTGKPNPAALAAAPVDVSPGSPMSGNLPAIPGSASASTLTGASTGTPGEPTAPLTAGGDQATPGGGAAGPVAPVIKPVSLWRDRYRITGPVAGAMAAVSNIPGLGDPLEYITKARADAKLFSERLVDSLLKSTAGSVREQERIRGVLQVDPSVATDPDVYGTRLISLGDAIRTTINENLALHRNQQAKDEDRLKAYKKAQELQKIYNQLDLPPVAYSEQEARRLFQAGHPEVLWYGVRPIQPRSAPLATQTGR